MLVVFSRLELAEADRERIERFRRSWDPQHGFVGAHFTHVFPFSGVAVEEVIRHVEPVAAETGRLRFRLGSAAAIRDPLDPVSRVFLLPAEGARDLKALHERLYSGLLAPQLRADLPYQPHVTVAAFARHAEAERAAAAFGEVAITGHLSALDLAEIRAGQLRDLRRFPLQARQA